MDIISKQYGITINQALPPDCTGFAAICVKQTRNKLIWRKKKSCAFFISCLSELHMVVLSNISLSHGPDSVAMVINLRRKRKAPEVFVMREVGNIRSCVCQTFHFSLCNLIHLIFISDSQLQVRYLLCLFPLF